MLSRLTLCDPTDCSPSGSSVHGILQARVLEWVTISFSRGSSQPRDWTWVSRIAGRHFTIWATREVKPENEKILKSVLEILKTLDKDISNIITEYIYVCVYIYVYAYVYIHSHALSACGHRLGKGHSSLISRAPITVTIADMLFIAIFHTPHSPHIHA